VAGLAYGFSAPLILWSLHPHSDVHAMLPWMMLGAEGALAARSWGIPALGAAVALAALGGHPESLLLDGLLVVAWVAFRLAQRVPWRERALRAARIAGGVALGFAASAIVLLPLLELLHQSPVRQRGGFPGAGLKALWT